MSSSRSNERTVGAGGVVAGLSTDRPSEIVLAARVARQFYLEGVSKVAIAERRGISRFRVARLLGSAREAGMVRIEIGLPGGSLDTGLSAELCSAFGLRHAYAFNVPDDDYLALRRRMGEAAGEVLMDIITPADVLGMSWARSLSGLAAALTGMPPCPIVQLTGAGPPPDRRDLLPPVSGVGEDPLRHRPHLRRLQERRGPRGDQRRHGSRPGHPHQPGP